MLFTEIEIHSQKRLTRACFTTEHTEDTEKAFSFKKISLCSLRALWLGWLFSNRHRGAAGEVQLIARAAGVDSDFEVIGAAEQRAHFTCCGLGVSADDPADAMRGGRNLDA